MIVADLLEGVPVWAAPLRRLCTYCASPGRERVQILAPAPPDGCCRVCGEQVEPMVCVPGVECDPPHRACTYCGEGTGVCGGCLGSCVNGCVFCHGTGRELPNHCCDCRRPAGDCRCVLVVTPRGLEAV